MRDDGVGRSPNDGVDVSRDEGGEDGSHNNGKDGFRANGEGGSRENGEDGNRNDRVDGSRDAGVSLWLLVAYLETETRQPLNDSTLVLSQSDSLELDDIALGIGNGSWTLASVAANVYSCHTARCLSDYVGLTRGHS